MLHDAAGGDMRATESFESKEEAEAWMGAEWASLLQEGAEEVSLVAGGDVVYRMGLREE
jgi:hypothetical protein